MKVNFKELPKYTKTPILTYCRQLIAKGVDPDEKLEIYRNNEDYDVLVNNIGDAAKLNVSEDDRVGPRFVKFKDWSPSSLKKGKSIPDEDVLPNSAKSKLSTE